MRKINGEDWFHIVLLGGGIAILLWMAMVIGPKPVPATDDGVEEFREMVDSIREDILRKDSAYRAEHGTWWWDSTLYETKRYD